MKEKFKNLMNMHDKINDKNYIIAEIDIKEEDINKDIRIINSFEEYKRENGWYGGKEDEYQNEKEIKKCKIKINNKMLSFSYFYKFTNIGKYKIIYEFRNKLKNVNYMFYGCESLTNINFFNFNSQNVIDMSYMFSGCRSLTNLNLSNFNTQNVTDMSNMFSGCKSLKKENVITKDITILNLLN